MSCLGPVFCHGCARGCQERGGVELRLEHFIINTEITEIAGEQVHTKGMTLILDKDTGNTEDL